MTEAHDEFECEPIRGLPERPPPGEHILWQGAPAWWPLAKQAFHVRAVTAYFLLLIAGHGAWYARETGSAPLPVIMSPVPVAIAALALLLLVAWLASRTTVYTITNRRVVLRAGIALPIAINIPFALIGRAGLRIHGDGTGDIPLGLMGSERVGYITLWPHVRPWRLKAPEPMLRAVPGAVRVAELLADALEKAGNVRGALPAASGCTSRPSPRHRPEADGRSAKMGGQMATQ